MNRQQRRAELRHIGASPLAAHHNDRGVALRRQGRADDAAACYRRAIRLRPDFAFPHNGLGNLARDAGQLDEAIEWYRKAIRLDSGYADAYQNLGYALGERRQFAEAVLALRTAITLNPFDARMHLMLALILLITGDFAAGWAEYEWRYNLVGQQRGFATPRWHGEAAPGKTVLVYVESGHGFGDTLMFCRLCAQAANRGLRVILEVQKPLVDLMRSLREPEMVLAQGDRLPPFDLHCSIYTLVPALGIVVSTIPDAVPYLHADNAEAAAWQARLASIAGRKLRIGLVWAGDPRIGMPELKAMDERRSIDPTLLAPLLDIPGVCFVSLQKDGPTAPAIPPLIDFMTEMDDFADTAALIENLDLVISVDTAVAHLAGALGKPVWLLDRYDHCWRWLEGRTDSPWYPTMRIFRQPSPGDWDSVIAAVKQELQIAAS